MNAISFSLFGKKPLYNVGLVRNIEVMPVFYPSWESFVYYDNSVSKETLLAIENQATLINVDDLDIPKVHGALWRFLVHDREGVNRYIVRDADSLVFLREKEAVDEWIESGKSLHIMRDHPLHNHLIMAGMWGLKKDDFNMEEAIKEYSFQFPERVFLKTFDQEFLRDVIYPKYKNDMLVHSSIDHFQDGSVPFPSPLVDFRFVGEMIMDDGSRYLQVPYEIWKEHKEIRI